MSIIAEKQEALHDYITAQNITSALRDISALKLREIREEVERGKTYYKEVESIYRVIKYYALKKNVELSAETATSKGPKTLAVAVTSNKRFYGSLNHDVMTAFLAHMKEAAKSRQIHDFYVVGRTGKEFIRGTNYSKGVQFFEFRDDDPTAYETITFIDTTRRYNHVLMFYPRFVNVFKQEITVSDITYVPESGKVEDLEQIEYIFEPEIGEMFWFFDTQVRYILFNETMLEVKLARLAARLVRMNRSEQNAREAVKNTKTEIRKVTELLNNMRLLETFSGMKKWKERA